MNRRLKIETTPEELTAEADRLVEELRSKAERAAEHAVKKRVNVSLTPRGRVRKNGPCPCGSGRKFKKCCLDAVKDPEDDKNLPSPKAVRAYINKENHDRNTY